MPQKWDKQGMRTALVHLFLRQDAYELPKSNLVTIQKVPIVMFLLAQSAKRCHDIRQ